MISDDLKNKKTEELEKEAQKLRDDISKSYLELRLGKLNDVRKPRSQRKELARIITLLKQSKTDNLKKSQKDGKDADEGKSSKK